MKQLNLKSEIHYFGTFQQFVSEFSIGENDIIFSRKAFKKYFECIEGKPVFLYNDDFGKGEPTDSIIDKILSAFNSIKCKRIIAVGGGSIVDIGKLLALKNVSSAKDLFLRKIPVIKDKELILIPTTCGTGSEVTNVSIASIESLNTKYGLADDALYADKAVLIPELLEDLPFKVIMNSSIDALVHACESFLSPKATVMSRMYSTEAIKIILGVYCDIAKRGKGAVFEHLKELLFASTYAGVAFGLAGTAVVHAMAYPLGSEFHVPHGEANYQFFIECFKFYEKRMPEGRIGEISDIINKLLLNSSGSAFCALEKLLNSIFPIGNLSQMYGMKAQQCAEFAENVIKNQQRLLVNSYFTLTESEIESIYKIRL